MFVVTSALHLLEVQDFVVLAVGVGFAILLSLLFSSTFIKQMKSLIKAAQEMATGNANVAISSNGGGEIRELSASLRLIADNMQEQTEAASRIAKGDLQVHVTLKSDRDIQGKSLNQIVEALRELIAEMNNMSSEHDAGDIEVILPVEKFNGAYKVMAQGVNDMVNGHITVKKKAMAAVASFADGDFDVPLERFPGKKAFINDNVEKLRENVKQFIDSMNNMSMEHDAGDIDVIIPVEKFEGAYRVMAHGVNEMVKGHITVKKKAMAAVAAFAEGNFEAPLEQFPGKKAFINDNVEKLRMNLKNVNLEIHQLIGASQSGRLSERGDVSRFTGDWASMIQGLNGLIDAIMEPIQEASAVLEEMAKGNLHASVKGEYKGDHAKIKNALNETLSILSGYVSEISEVMTEMARGNMDVGIDSEYRGDFAAIKRALNHVIQSFNSLLHDINGAAGQVASSSMQVSGSAQLLSQGATEQASSVEQLTVSLEEIGVQTRRNAESAAEASDLAVKARLNAVDGNEHMKHMLGAMDGINEASGNISKIIKVIDEIAFQTNILALNAAVEAARAGQHGKGFAVVAEEVRNLAARSANAAKETTVLIEGSIKKVEGGTKIANETASALNKIVEDVAKAADLVGEIAAASSEQATGITQINQGISVISEVTQTNSATSEESAAASEELSGQAEMLKEMVGRFKLKRVDMAMAGFRDDRYGGSQASGGETVPAYAKYDRVRQTAVYTGRSETAAASAGGAIKIALSDREYGKY
ncbi:HAMP domain-containing protein [Paenibacillus albus]|uniref:HAMP domain-containing protein n=2 Tax=Paenibacillus albus TaxID=2495582 RepID=A0A3Q8X9N8_9BACL|nr:HAMP domain-containing protein [Paenibacillus albus]